MSGSAGLAGALLSRKFGHGAKTDGFFAAYAVYVALVLVASALRVVVLPRFARAQAGGVAGRELGSWLLALAVPLVPVIAISIAAPHAVAGLLTGKAHARTEAAQLVPWLFPAAAAQIYAGVAASALAALDDYVTAAIGFAAGAVAGLVVIVALVSHGVVAFGWGLLVNALVSLAIPLFVLIRRAAIGVPDRALLPRLRELAEGVALPFALQGLYVIGNRLAAGLGSGDTTTFSYAYLIAGLLVALTATSVALISSVPLARAELTPAVVTRHVVAASWLSLAVVAGAAGLFAIAGSRVARIALGSSYGGQTGAELGRLVAYLAPWMVASIAVSVAFPLLFVRGRARWLPLLAVGALGLHVLIELAGRAAFGLAGIAAGLAVTTALILLVLLRALGALKATMRGLLLAAASCGIPAVVLFGGPRLLVGPVPAALIGAVLYAGVIAFWRPAGLTNAWAYLRGLH